jgi:hypothetical protein
MRWSYSAERQVSLILEVRLKMIPIDPENPDMVLTIWRWEEAVTHHTSPAEGASYLGTIQHVDIAGYVPGLRSCYIDGRSVTLEAFREALDRVTPA